MLQLFGSEISSYINRKILLVYIQSETTFKHFIEHCTVQKLVIVINIYLGLYMLS